jgi:hypothetical protein
MMGKGIFGRGMNGRGMNGKGMRGKGMRGNIHESRTFHSRTVYRVSLDGREDAARWRFALALPEAGNSQPVETGENMLCHRSK